MVRLPFIFVSPAKADDALLFARQPDDCQYGRYLSNIRKRLSSDFSITGAFKFKAIATGQHKPCISKVKMMFFQVYQTFCSSQIMIIVYTIMLEASTEYAEMSLRIQ